jgi:hypothetical protein
LIYDRVIDAENWSSRQLLRAARDQIFHGHKVATVEVDLTAYGRRSKCGETPDRTADLPVA